MSAAAIRALFRLQAADCRDLGSPFTAGLMDILAKQLDPATPIGLRVLTWPVNPNDKLPLRLAGGLHWLARSGLDPDLTAAYPPHDARGDSLAGALTSALHRHGDWLMPWLDGPPQTNEVARSAVLIAAGHWLTARFALPLHLSELGASAGLNLLWDHYALNLPGLTLGPPDPALVLKPNWSGPLPPNAPPRVLSRAASDIAPLDPVADRDRLRAYIWADQTARLDRFDRAMALAARLGQKVTRADAGLWAEQRLSTRFPGALHLICHTIAASYFPAATKDRLSAALAAAGARATPTSPLAHLGLEDDGTPPGAVLTLTLWPGGEVIPLGRADFHGRWIRWTG